MHGFGPVEVSLPDFPSVLDQRIIDTASAPGAEFPFQEDFQAGDGTGICEQRNWCLLFRHSFGFLALVQSTVGNGARSSSAVAYLAPALNRPNMHVLLHNTVTRLVKTGSSHGVPSFKKVEFAPSASGSFHNPETQNTA